MCHRELAIVALSLAWTAALQILCVAMVHDGDLTGPFLVGQERSADWDWPLKVATVPGPGYDGQFFLLLAFEPIPSQETAQHLDLPAYRTRRLLWPLLAHVTGWGQPRLVLLALYAWSAVFVALGSWALARWLRQAGLSPWWSLLFAANLGVVVCSWRMLEDCVMATCLLWTFVSLRDKRPYRVGIWLLAALLAKEAALAAWVGVTVSAAVQRDRRLLAIALVVLVLTVCWWGWIAWALPDGSGAANFGPPFLGVLHSAAEWLRSPRSLWRVGKDFFAAAIYLLAAALGIAACFRSAREGAVPRALAVTLALYGVLAVALSDAVWTEVWAFSRVLLPLPVLLTMWPVAGESRAATRLRWLPFVASGLLGIAFALVRVVSRTP